MVSDPGIYPDVSEVDYHGDLGSLSVSGAKLLLPPSCPAKFRHTMDNPRKPKREFDFGHVAHELLLGKGSGIFVLDPEVHGLTKDGKVAASPAATAGWKQAAMEARERGEVPVSRDVYDAALAMASAVHAHPAAGPLFADGVAEQSMYARDPATGVTLRGRTDWITTLDGRITIVDFKTSTTANPAELVRKWWLLNYHMQAAWYIDLAASLGLDDPDFLFVAAEKEPPHLVTVHRYFAEAIEEGRAANRRAIETYVRCMESGEWPGYADEIEPLTLPRWAYASDETNTAAAALIAELENIA